MSELRFNKTWLAIVTRIVVFILFTPFMVWGYFDTNVPPPWMGLGFLVLLVSLCLRRIAGFYWDIARYYELFSAYAKNPPIRPMVGSFLFAIVVMAGLPVIAVLVTTLDFMIMTFDMSLMTLSFMLAELVTYITVAPVHQYWQNLVYRSPSHPNPYDEGPGQ
jgi:hypothetical protein